MATTSRQSVDTGDVASTDVEQQDNSGQQSQQSVEQSGKPSAPKARKKPPAKNPNMKRTGRPASGPEAIAMVEQQAKALEYRKMGLNFQQIGEKLGITHNAAWENVQAALKRCLQEPAADVRKLELERLDAMMVSAYGNALRGDLMAHSAVLNIMNRRAKLLGLDAPVRTDNKTELSGEAAGVFVLSPVMTPDAWDVAAKAQQAALVKDTQPAK